MKCFLDKNLADYGNHFFWDIPVERVPHALLVGSSGSGKTFATKILLARFAHTSPRATFLIGDYKADSDFAFLDGCKGFKRFEEVSELLTLALSILENRQKGMDTSREFVVICFDEFNAWQNSLDKKEREQAIKDYTRLIQLDVPSRFMSLFPSKMLINLVWDYLVILSVQLSHSVNYLKRQSPCFFLMKKMILLETTPEVSAT